MRNVRSARLLLILIASTLLAVPNLSHAYLDEAWLVGTDVELIKGPGTIRLAGMGNLTIAVEDENNQVNLYDFTGNVASLIFDKRVRNHDTWANYAKWTDVKDGFRWQDVGVWQGGTMVVLRKEGSYAGGASISSRVVDFTRVDDRVLRERLRVAYPKSEIFHPDTSIIDMETSGTAIEAYFAHKVLGKVYAGVRGWGVFDGEKRSPRLRYEVTNEASDVGAGLGVVAFPLSWVQVGGTVDLGSQLVEAVSKDAFHDDLFSRKRSIPAYSTHAAFDLIGKLRGVVNYKRCSYEADQTLLMNWSDRYIINPQEIDIHMKLKIGSESLVSNQFATRWILSNLGVPVTVTAHFDMMTEDSWYRQEPNVLVWTEEFDQYLQQWNLAGGASYTLLDRGLLGVEVRLNRGRLENRMIDEKGQTNFKALDLRGGAEYRVLPWLALRGGYARSAEERFMGVPEEDFVSSAFSAGLGFLLKDERLAFDAAFLQRTTEPEADLGVSREIKYQSLMLYGRFIF